MLNNVTVITSAAGGVGASTLTVLLARVATESPIFGGTDDVAVVDISGRLGTVATIDGGEATLAEPGTQIGDNGNFYARNLPGVGTVYSAGLGGALAHPLNVIEYASQRHERVFVDASSMMGTRLVETLIGVTAKTAVVVSTQSNMRFTEDLVSKMRARSSKFADLLDARTMVVLQKNVKADAGKLIAAAVPSLELAGVIPGATTVVDAVDSGVLETLSDKQILRGAEVTLAFLLGGEPKANFAASQTYVTDAKTAKKAEKKARKSRKGNK
jgi:hypothetical protein